MSFDLLAPHYRWMEWLLAGEKLQRCRTRWLPDVQDCRKVLIAGVGHGRFLSSCLQALPGAEIVCLDSSEGMLREARKRTAALGKAVEQVSFIHGSLPEWNPPAGRFDLIATHFFFDCFPQPVLEQLIARLSSAAQPHARWLVSEFHLADCGPQRLRAQVILKSAYLFFRIATRLPARTLPSYRDAMLQNGFTLQNSEITEWGLLTSNLFQR
jgi:ubiquinone/menaquinone biosynthesis C-methylase UbiE